MVVLLHKVEKCQAAHSEKRGGKIAISGFGTFETRKRAAREWRDPRTGKASDIKAGTVPTFRASRSLRDLVNRKR